MRKENESAKWCFAVRKITIGSQAEVEVHADLLLHQIVYKEKEKGGEEPELIVRQLNSAPIELKLDRATFSLGSTPTSLDISFQSVLTTLAAIFQNAHAYPIQPPGPTPGETLLAKKINKL